MTQMVQKTFICPMATLLVFWHRNWSPITWQNVLPSKLKLRHKPRPCHETTLVSLAAAINWFVNSPRQMGSDSHAAHTT